MEERWLLRIHSMGACFVYASLDNAQAIAQTSWPLKSDNQLCCNNIDLGVAVGARGLPAGYS